MSDVDDLKNMVDDAEPESVVVHVKPAYGVTMYVPLTTEDGGTGYGEQSVMAGLEFRDGHWDICLTKEFTSTAGLNHVSKADFALRLPDLESCLDHGQHTIRRSGRNQGAGIMKPQTIAALMKVAEEADFEGYDVRTPNPDDTTGRQAAFIAGAQWAATTMELAYVDGRFFQTPDEECRAHPMHLSEQFRSEFRSLLARHDRDVIAKSASESEKALGEVIDERDALEHRITDLVNDYAGEAAAEWSSASDPIDNLRAWLENQARQQKQQTTTALADKE